MPLLSVVIPSYNHELYIEKAIKSVLNQTYDNIELIIIDDGSKDKSVDIIKSVKDERIKLVCQQNSGAHNAINKGLEMAKGEYLAILNSDDIYDKKRFQIMINELENNEKAEFACSYIQVIDSNDKKLGIKEGWRNMEPWSVPDYDKSFNATDDFKYNLMSANFTATTSNFLFKRSLYKKIGGMRNLRFAHDWDFALRAAEVTDCLMIEKPLIKYRIHNSNTISSDRKWMLFEIAWMWATNLKRFNKALLFNGDDKRSVEMLGASLNLQGNDKVLWMILMYIEAKRNEGINNPEEILLEDKELRDKFIEFIVE